jgi:hypothetical protein
MSSCWDVSGGQGAGVRGGEGLLSERWFGPSAPPRAALPVRCQSPPVAPSFKLRAALTPCPWWPISQQPSTALALILPGPCRASLSDC